MKKLLTIVLFVSSCFCTVQQNGAQSNEMDNLREQISALKNSNSRLEGKLKQHAKISANVHDSLLSSLNHNNSKLQTLSDSLKAKELLLNTVKVELNNATSKINSTKNANTVQYIGMILIITVLLIICYLASKKINKMKVEQETNLVKLEEGMEANLYKTKNEIRTEITAVKQEFKTKINDLEIKLAALNDKKA